MKKLVFLSLLMLMSNSSYSQILPIEDLKDKYIFNDDDPSMSENGITYVKDVNHKLPKFVGTWKGQRDGVTYEVKIEEFLYQHPLTKIKEDLLIMRYKLSNATGDIENTLNLLLDHPLIINGYYLNSDNSYMFSYKGEERRCGQKGNIYVSLSNTTNINLHLLPYEGMLNGNECAKPAEHILPIVPIALTKQ